MMSKILTVEQAIDTSKKLREQQKKIVLVGGCFDILHIGHVIFLEESRKHGDTLLLLLESDETIKINKNSSRPINPQRDRAIILSSLKNVDFVIMLPRMSDKEYDDLISAIKPDIIATTKGDPGSMHKQRQAKQTGAVLLEVTERIDVSTSKLAQRIQEQF